MDVLTYVAQELPNKRSSHVAKQLDVLGLEPGKTIKDSKKKILQFYLDNHLSELLEYYQSGVKVVNPVNKEGLTTMVNKLFGVWELVDSTGNPVPPTLTKPYNELHGKFHKLEVV
jgi:hypothetical protein